jgi:hypothetical protein
VSERRKEEGGGGNVLKPRLVIASAPSRLLRASAARERTGAGKAETMTWGERKRGKERKGKEKTE